MSERTEPLKVLVALVHRGDSMRGDAARASRPRYNVNRAGQGIDDAGVNDRTLALTAHPQLEWEAFDEYWRKVHGPKIVHAEGAGGIDRITPTLVFYLQQHRVPGGPTSQLAPPYAPQLGADGRLLRDPAAHVAPYQRPPFDGLALLAYRSVGELEAFFDTGPGKYGDKIVPDEAVFIRGFAFHVAEEHVIVASGERRRDPIVLCKLHVRKQGTSRAEFMARWSGAHAELIRALPAAAGIRRYAQLRNISRPGDRVYDGVGDRYDGCAVWSFANMNDLEEFLASPHHARVAADEADFCQETVFFTTLNYVIRDDS